MFPDNKLPKQSSFYNDPTLRALLVSKADRPNRINLSKSKIGQQGFSLAMPLLIMIPVIMIGVGIVAGHLLTLMLPLELALIFLVLGPAVVAFAFFNKFEEAANREELSALLGREILESKNRKEINKIANLVDDFNEILDDLEETRIDKKLMHKNIQKDSDAVLIFTHITGQVLAENIFNNLGLNIDYAKPAGEGREILHKIEMHVNNLRTERNKQYFKGKFIQELEANKIDALLNLRDNLKARMQQKVSEFDIESLIMKEYKNLDTKVSNSNKQEVYTTKKFKQNG